MKRDLNLSLILISFILFFQPTYAIKSNNNEKTQTISIYKKGWIDFNKNGVKDIYEDPTQSIDSRIQNLLSQMTMDEKTCQMATLYGYGKVLIDSLPTPAWKTTEIWKDGIGNIDEHLNGWSEPGKAWGRKETEIKVMQLPITADIKNHVRAINSTQRFFVEDTRLGIPVDFTNECIGGVCGYNFTSFPYPIGLGCTWNKNLIREIGEISAQEARAMGYTNVYAPVLDVVRDQRWGRVEENYGEATYLVSQFGVAMVKGLQKDFMVAATAKHFALYSANFGAREGEARTDPQIPRREAEPYF